MYLRFEISGKVMLSDDIEIKEPPLKELTRARRERRWGRRWCMGCSPGCLGALLIFAGIFTVIFFITTGPTITEKAPADFPNTIPVYKPQGIARIVYLSASRRNRGLEFAAFVPKLFLYPVARGLEVQSKKKFGALVPHIDLRNELVDARNFLEFLKTPIGPQMNTTAIVWRKLAAQPEFLLDFYKGELERKGYATDAMKVSEAVSYFAFTSTAASGWVSVKPSKVEEYGTEELVLIVEYQK